MTTDPALTAAAEAMWGHIWPNGYTDEPYSREEDDRAFLLADAAIAVAAARPIIEAEVLAQYEHVLATTPCECDKGHRVFIDDGEGTVYRCPLCELAEIRERIAAEIEAEFVGQDHHEPTFNSGRDAGLRLAARVARGTA